MSNNGNSNKENFDSQFPHIDFLKLKCKNCNIEISSSKLEVPIDYKKDDDIIKIDKNYLKFILIGKEQKLSSDKTFVYCSIRCMNCQIKLGKLVILGNEITKIDLQKCILKKKKLIFEYENNSINNNFLKQKEKTEKFFQSHKYKYELLNHIKLIIKDNNKLCDDCIEELNSFIKIQDYFIENGLKFEDYILKIFDKIENEKFDFIEKFLEILKKEKKEKNDEKKEIIENDNNIEKNKNNENNQFNIEKQKEGNNLKRKSKKNYVDNKKKKSKNY
jgi:hypothetical protein